jgi:signal recognition particle subunit SEC65
MRYFNSRITLAQPSTFGMFYLITESVSFDPQNSKRGFRCVLFDINGSVVYRPNLEELENTSTKAEKTFYKWFETFNPKTYYKNQIKEKIIQTNRQAQNLEECLGLFEEVAA